MPQLRALINHRFPGQSTGGVALKFVGWAPSLAFIGLTLLGIAYIQGDSVADGATRQGFDAVVLADGTRVKGNIGTLKLRALNTGEELTINLTGSYGQPDYTLKMYGNQTDAASALAPGAGVIVLMGSC